jgi:hypothetical protein
VFGEVEDLHNVRMADLGSDSGLGSETLRHRMPLRRMRVHALHRHRAPQDLINRRPHLRHPADGNLPDQPVPG